jgi:hypothetical protein
LDLVIFQHTRRKHFCGAKSTAAQSFADLFLERRLRRRSAIKPDGAHIQLIIGDVYAVPIVLTPIFNQAFHEVIQAVMAMYPSSTDSGGVFKRGWALKDLNMHFFVLRVV